MRLSDRTIIQTKAIKTILLALTTTLAVLAGLNMINPLKGGVAYRILSPIDAAWSRWKQKYQRFYTSNSD